MAGSYDIVFQITEIVARICFLTEFEEHLGFGNEYCNCNNVKMQKITFRIADSVPAKYVYDT